MNLFIISGRLSSDPEIKYTNDGKAVARFNFAVNRTFKRDGEPEADFFSCVVFGKSAENFEKLHISKGTKLLLKSEVRNNNYTDKNGAKQYGTQVVVSEFEFCESKKYQSQEQDNIPPTDADGFMSIPDGVEDEGLPFN